MTQVCRTCNHTNRLDIDRALVSGKSKASVAREFGVSVDSLSYHAEHHLSRQLVQAYEKKEALEGLNLLSEIEDLLQRTKRILTEAEKKKKYNLALRAIREARGVYELLSKIAFALHQARLTELELERERDGTAAVERDVGFQERLSILTDAELDVLVMLLLKVHKQTPELVKLDVFLPDRLPYRVGD